MLGHVYTCDPGDVDTYLTVTTHWTIRGYTIRFVVLGHVYTCDQRDVDNYLMVTIH
jgi:hypothetical protein